MDFAVCSSVIINKSLYTKFGTSSADFDASLIIKMLIFQSLNMDEGLISRINMPLLHSSSHQN